MHSFALVLALSMALGVATAQWPFWPFGDFPFGSRPKPHSDNQRGGGPPFRPAAPPHLMSTFGDDEMSDYVPFGQQHGGGGGAVYATSSGDGIGIGSVVSSSGGGGRRVSGVVVSSDSSGRHNVRRFDLDD